MPAKKRKNSSSNTTAMSSKKPAKKVKTKTNIPERSRNATAGKIGKNKNNPITITDNSDDEFYSTNTGDQLSPIHQSLNKIFDSYRDDPSTQPDKINIDGAQKYLSDLSIALDEVVHVAVCDILSCPSIGEFDREQFVSGWISASTPPSNGPNSNSPPAIIKPLDTVARQKYHVSSLRTRITSDPAYFRTVYRAAFKLAKPEAQRSVPLDSALEFWRMLFSASSGGIEWSSKSTPWLDLWCEFYETRGKRPVTKDLWNMVGELVQKTKEPGGESLEWWAEDGAWPMVVDEFVAWVKEKRKAGDEMDAT